MRAPAGPDQPLCAVHNRSAVLRTGAPRIAEAMRGTTRQTYFGAGPWPAAFEPESRWTIWFSAVFVDVALQFAA